MYLLYMACFFLAKIMPIKACYAVAEKISRQYAKFAVKDREGLRENLKVILGRDVDERVVDKHAAAVFKNFAKYLADFFKFPKFTEENISGNIAIEGREYIDECLSEGKGVILLSLHLGNWELGGAIVGGLKYPISAIVLEHASKRVNDLFIRQRALNGLRSIPVGGRIKECFETLRRNEILAIIGDKDYTSSGIYVDFFGKKALMPKGPAVISLKTGAPIVFCALIRKKDDTYKFCFEKPIRYKTTGDYNKDMRAIMGEYLRIFEKYIRESPDQWYAFRKLWDQEEITQ